jgi:hypothetical protein
MFQIVSVQKATPLSNQQWRDFLLDGLLSLSKESIPKWKLELKDDIRVPKESI